jgi:hypothetical protein
MPGLRQVMVTTQAAALRRRAIVLNAITVFLSA